VTGIGAVVVLVAYHSITERAPRRVWRWHSREPVAVLRWAPRGGTARGQGARPVETTTAVGAPRS